MESARAQIGLLNGFVTMNEPPRRRRQRLLATLAPHAGRRGLVAAHVLAWLKDWEGEIGMAVLVIFTVICGVLAECSAG